MFCTFYLYLISPFNRQVFPCLAVEQEIELFLFEVIFDVEICLCSFRKLLVLSDFSARNATPIE